MPTDGAHDRFDWRRHGLYHQLRIRIGVALTVLPRYLRAQLLKPGDGPPPRDRAAITERIIDALSAFDVRWKGDTSDDPHALPPETRQILAHRSDRKEEDDLTM